MLTELSVRNLGTVEDAKLEFQSGLTVITGETGAGKSLLLTGLRLLMGGRSDSKMVRLDAPRADVSGVWKITDENLEAALEERSAALEGSELYISRFIQNDGKSRLSLAGCPVPTSSMNDLAPRLVEIHGQSDQLKLRDAVAQRNIVDSFGGEKLAKALTAYKTKFKHVRELQAEVKDLEENANRREFELRYNQDLSARFEALDPQENEQEELEAEIQKIAHLEDIATGLSEALALVLPEEIDSPLSTLEQAAALLRKLSKYDGELATIAGSLEDSIAAVEPVLDELETYSSGIDLESLQKLHELEDRLQELKVFAKPFGGDLNRAIQESLKAQEVLSSAGEALDLDELRGAVTYAITAAEEAAEKLTKLRKESADKLSAAVNVELEGLSMRGTGFVIEVNPKNLAADGADEVAFMVETQGKNRRPITKAASGGELSRIMLSLEVVTAGDDERKTFIFDEVDSGIGGTTAIEIGRRLAQLSKLHQVIVVTHLPQVAAFGDAHWVVAKKAEDAGVSTAVLEVREAARTKEVARMLSGLDSTDSGLAHADELLKTAEEAKAKF